ncbi:hypothetical protein L249_0886 [Ophiocordyceps polyrhachis-furcata BCC 54312]|uniref:Uncharacterized protein n=1 Tax=Ophiocordyceps polyrhachis-furcata BCC 54312 TaxID=1330021 RepID=A0A367LCY5_9HYPO|nr:hypothetical protein L249_0886 [Ophiocordyceps polyrhachis-furcata BCC 54312]
MRAEPTRRVNKENFTAVVPHTGIHKAVDNNRRRLIETSGHWDCPAYVCCRRNKGEPIPGAV